LKKNGLNTREPLLNPVKSLVAPALPLLCPALPLFVLDLPFVALTLKRKSFLIISRNLLDERRLVSYQQSHGFLKMVVCGGTFSRGHAPQFITPDKLL
jgi:hypothetical protein